MEWGKPDMLWALTALIIPLLIHLLQLRRYKEVKFSNVSFLDSVNKEAKAQHRLKNLLVLLTRLIAVGAIVLAFADPFIPFSDSENDGFSGNVVCLYVDNSPSMEATGENGTLLQTAKSNAIEIVEQYPETDRFYVITNEFSGSDSRHLTKEECIETIASVKGATIARNVSEVVTRASDFTSSSTNRNHLIYLLSDLQKGTHNLSEDFKPDTNLSIHFLPSFANERPNIWIDSSWFSSPIATTGKPAELLVRMKHNATSSVEGLNMNLKVNGSRKSVGTYNINPGLETDTVIRFSFDAPGQYHAEISIDDSPISFDNKYYLGFEVVEKIKVLQICRDINSSSAESIKNVCATNSSSIEFETRTTLPDENELKGYDLVISNGISSPSNGFSNTLNEFASSGGAVLVIPDTLEINSRFEFLMNSLKLGAEFEWVDSEDMVSMMSLNTEHPHFDGVFSSTPSRMDLPKSRKALSYRANAEVESLGLNWNSSNFLAKSKVEKGVAFLFGIPLSNEVSNLTSHALFVPFILRMVETSRASELRSITLGVDNSLQIRKEIAVGSSVRIVSTDSTESIIPESRVVNGETRLLLGPALTKPGNYSVQVNSNSQTNSSEFTELVTVGVNANRLESNPESYDVPGYRKELENMGWGNASVLEVSSANLSTLIKNIESGKHLWWYLVLIVLLALTGETVLQKRWKVTS